MCLATLGAGPLGGAKTALCVESAPSSAYGFVQSKPDNLRAGGEGAKLRGATPGNLDCNGNALYDTGRLRPVLINGDLI